MVYVRLYRKTMSKALYKFYLDYGRMGELEGIFVADPEDIEKAIGKEVYFGEVLGKHSEVFCMLTESHFSFITDKQEVINMIEMYDLETGFNPIQYLEDNDEDDWDDEEEA